MEIKLRDIQSRDVKVGDILIYPYNHKMVGMLPYVVTAKEQLTLKLSSGRGITEYPVQLMRNWYLNITDSLSQKQKENALLTIMSQNQPHPQNINEASKTDINIDCIGEPINIGDNVLFAKRSMGRTVLYLGLVKSLTAKKVRLYYAPNHERKITALIDKHRVLNMNSYISHYAEVFL